MEIISEEASVLKEPRDVLLHSSDGGVSNISLMTLSPKLQRLTRGTESVHRKKHGRRAEFPRLCPRAASLRDL